MVPARPRRRSRLSRAGLVRLPRRGQADPEKLPNNWPSDFGGPAWSKAPDGQWYLHLFDSSQPDLNWENPQVRDAFLDILRFWLDRGVDGFRVDVAHALIKAQGLPDFDGSFEDLITGVLPTNASPWYDQEGVHEIFRSWREVLDSYDGDRAMVAEAWVWPHDRLARYVRADEYHQAFNFTFLDTAWRVDALREGITESFRANDAVGAPTTWVLSNHDVVRHATRLGFSDARRSPWLAADEPTPDAVLGLRRARAATTMLLALRQHLPLPGRGTGPSRGDRAGCVPPYDPTFHRTARRLGRDGCRVPLPWIKDAPAYGFSPTGATWLPQPAAFGDLAADQQEGVPSSTLELYRSLLAIRRERRLGEGSLAFADLGEGLLAFDVTVGSGNHPSRTEPRRPGLAIPGEPASSWPATLP